MIVVTIDVVSQTQRVRVRLLENGGQTVSVSKISRIRVSEVENVAPATINTCSNVQVDRELVSLPECQILADQVVFLQRTACLSEDLNKIK